MRKNSKTSRIARLEAEIVGLKVEIENLRRELAAMRPAVLPSIQWRGQAPMQPYSFNPLKTQRPFEGILG